MVDSLSAKVHFIAGKGGVGKTLLAKALAQYFSAEHKTLLVELSEEETKERAGVATIEKIGPNYSYVKIFPDQSLYEYLSIKIPQKKVLDTFLSQTLFRALSSAMPGLADLTRLGKIWFHADALHEPRGEIFEKIVVDMPSTGFVGRFLTIASVVHSAVKIGPLAKEAEFIHRYFKNKSHARIHIACMPQDLVVNETLELVDEIARKKSIHLGMVLINRVLMVDDITDDMIKAVAPYPELLKVIRACKARHDEEMHQLKRLKTSGWPVPTLVFAELTQMDESIIIDEMAQVFWKEQHRESV